MHPATVVNAYKAAIYQANPDTFSTKATTHAYAGDVYAASHLGDLAVVDNGELTARSKVNAHTQAVYGAMAGDAVCASPGF
jgi:outer membrane lipoprotein SlyB